MDVKELIYNMNKTREKMKTVTEDIEKITNTFTELESLFNFLKSLKIKWVKTVTENMGKITRLCLKTILGENYDIEIKIEKINEKYSCKIYVIKDGVSYDPKYEVGGGVNDVISLGLRLGYILLENNKWLVLDEPLKFLSKDKRNIADLFDMLHKKLNINIICVTHTPELISENAYVIALE